MLATLMASITVLTYALFAHALAGPAPERTPAAPSMTHTGPHQSGA